MGRDIAAFFIGGGTDSGNDTSVSSILNGQPSTSSVSDEMDSFYSVIDRCGMSVIVDQVCLFPPWIISLQICRLVHTLLSILVKLPCTWNYFVWRSKYHIQNTHQLGFRFKCLVWGFTSLLKGMAESWISYLYSIMHQKIVTWEPMNFPKLVSHLGVLLILQPMLDFLFGGYAIYYSSFLLYFLF